MIYRKIFAFGLILTALLVGCKKGKTDAVQKRQLGALQIQSPRPKPGEAISLSYRLDQSGLKGKKDIHGTYYALVGRKLYAKDLSLTAAGDTLGARFTIPDSAQALAFRFSSGDKQDDNHRKGYVIPLYDARGELLAGSQAAIGNFYLGAGPRLTGIRYDRAAALALIQSDLAEHPQLAKTWENPYRLLRYRIDPLQGKKDLEQGIASLEAKRDLDERALSTLQGFYRLLNEKEKADSLKRLSIERFPQGEAAEQQALKAIHNTEDLNKATQLYQQYSTQFKKRSDAFQDYAALELALRYADKGEIDQAQAFAKAVSGNLSLLLANAYNQRAWPMAEKGKNLKQAEKLSKTALQQVEKALRQQGDRPPYLSPEEWKARIRYFHDIFLATYALIRFKQGAIREAIAKQATLAGVKARPSINERYIQFLLADRQYEAVRTRAVQYLEAGVGTPQLQAYLKQAYQKSGRSLKDYKALAKELEANRKKRLITQLKGEEIDRPAPDFTLKDLQGKPVSLSSLKGKVVVLDFWATWCGPCKASMPSMQKAVEAYRNDDKVKFLFINTWERSAPELRKKQVSNFIKTKGYPFRVLMDEKAAEGNDFQAVSAYGVESIPAKFVIGPRGHIRFAHTGYNPDPVAMLEEIQTMITLARAQAQVANR